MQKFSKEVVDISIHALREEGDGEELTYSPTSLNFYPRPPRGGRHAHSLILPSLSDFYPRPPRGGRPVTLRYAVRGFFISIHALREEGDATKGGGQAMLKVFLSTPSARRATMEEFFEVWTE